MTIRAKREPKLSSRQDAFPHQVAAVEAVRDLEYAAVFHEQGLGKTKIALDLCISWLSRGAVDSVLIVTKKTLIQNWQREVRFHTYISPTILDQDKRANFYAFNSPARLYLTHYEVCKSELKRLLLFQKTRRIGVFLDEAHRMKNPASGVAEALLALSPGFVRRVILTGTPVANRPFDLWAQIKFLDGGRALGRSFATFKSSLDLSKAVADDASKRLQFENALNSVQARISAFTVRETKDSADLELPNKTIKTVRADLEDRQASLYKDLRDELRAVVEREGGIKEERVDQTLKRLLRLVQVASNPTLVDESYDREPGKLPHLRLLVDAAVDSGDKVIVWTSFVENAEWLAREFRQRSAVRVHGGMSISDRNSALSRFMDKEDCSVLVATPGAAKEGLTLTVANHAVFYDRSFSLDDYLQAQDRIHRISQVRDCTIYNLIGAETVDEWVDELLAAKHLAAGLAQGDLTLGEYRERATYDYARMLKEVLGTWRGEDTR